MAHGIVKLSDGYLCAALEGSAETWHKLDANKRFKTWREMWNETVARRSVQRINLVDPQTGAAYPNFGLRVGFNDGTFAYPSNGATCAEGYTPQNTERLAELVGMVDQVFKLDFVAVLDDGFSDVFSFFMDGWVDIANDQHQNRLALHTRNNKTGADRWVRSSVRTVCANTRALAERYGKSMTARHTSDIDDRMRDIASPIIQQQFSAAADAFALDRVFYNALLALPAPDRNGKKDEFIDAVFGAKPDEGKAVAHWQSNVDKFFRAVAETSVQSPHLDNSAALWFNALTHNAKTARTKGDAKAVNAGKSLIGVNDGPVDLAYAFFTKAMETTTVALPSA